MRKSSETGDKGILAEGVQVLEKLAGDQTPSHLRSLDTSGDQPATCLSDFRDILPAQKHIQLFLQVCDQQ